MDQEKQDIKNETSSPATEQQNIEEVKEVIEQKSDELKSSDLSSPQPSPLDDIFEQRREHRDKVLKSILKLLWASFWLLALILTAQSLVRLCSRIIVEYLELPTVCNPDFVLIDETTLRIIAVSIFGQVVGVVYVISRNLFDDKIYMDIFKTKQ